MPAYTEVQCLLLGDIEGSSLREEGWKGKVFCFPLCVSYGRLELLCQGCRGCTTKMESSGE